ncbi:MAG: lysozyme [Ewingella sp.]|uniref:lysozyme n=1 Tax=Ewingella sp. TaxID=1897459 RepID=UPI003F8F491C
MAVSPGVKSKLSKAVIALIISGASASAILGQFLDEKEGNRLNSYQDGKGIWTICRGATRVDGKLVTQGMRLSAQKCDQVNQIEQNAAIAWVEKNVHVPLTAPQIAGIASFCPYNIGPGKCFPSTFYRKLNAGDRRGACAEIKRWVRDGGKDCNIRANNCFGQIERRDQESELTCWGLDG